MHRELLDRCPRDDGAIFLTAAKTNRGSVRGVPQHPGEGGREGVLVRTQDMILFQHRVRRNEQTESVCVCRIRFQETDSPRDKHDSPARTWSHPHATRPHLRAHTRTRPRARARPDARRRPRPIYVAILERLTLSTFHFF